MELLGCCDPSPWLMDFKDLELVERIGQGSFSRVSTAVEERGPSGKPNLYLTGCLVVMLRSIWPSGSRSWWL